MHLPLLMGNSILHCHRLSHSIVVLASRHSGPCRKSPPHTALWDRAGHQIGRAGWGVILGPPGQFPIPGASHFDGAMCSAC